MFGSDNQSGASKQVLDAVVEAFSSAAPAYGEDARTAQAEAALKAVFGCDLRAFFVGTGTAANCLALSALADPWGQVICHHQAHILNDEITAPEFYTGGARLTSVTPLAPKLEAETLDTWLAAQGDVYPHRAVPQVLSLAQVNEVGQVYSVGEIRALSRVASNHRMRVHMDGARFSNAVARLGCTPAELTHEAGVDVLCLGATKNGAIAAEAVIFFDPALAEGFIYRVKRAGQLLSKGRFYGAQFEAWLRDGHWLELAGHANATAERLAGVLAEIPGVEIPLPVLSNEVFAIVPDAVFAEAGARGLEVYDWDAVAIAPRPAPEAGRLLVRFVTSFITREAEIEALHDLAEVVPAG